MKLEQLTAAMSELSHRPDGQFYRGRELFLSIIPQGAGPCQSVGENDLESVSGSPWCNQLSSEVSVLEEVPFDHDYF